MRHAVLHGDVIKMLKTLPENSVDAVITSPPYWQLRDYGVAGQIGLEPTPAEWVATMIDVLREVRRVMAPWATCWLNVGDKWISDGGSGHQGNANSVRAHRRHTQHNLKTAAAAEIGRPKCMALIPDRLRIAMADDRWIIRAKAVWQKPTPMPESTKDRPTVDFEDIIMATKEETYFFDSFAVMETTTGNAHSRGRGHSPRASKAERLRPRYNESNDGMRERVGLRNLRSVWRIPATPFADALCLHCGGFFFGRGKRELAQPGGELRCLCGRTDGWVEHFATFPKGLPRLLVQASTSERGNCCWCGQPIERLVDRVRVGDWHPGPEKHAVGAVNRNTFKTIHGDRKFQMNTRVASARAAKLGTHDSPFPSPRHQGWRQCCDLNVGMTMARTPVVLDPFAGALTTTIVCEQMGRDSIAIDLNGDYLRLGSCRFTKETGKVLEAARSALSA